MSRGADLLIHLALLPAAVCVFYWLAKLYVQARDRRMNRRLDRQRADCLASIEAARRRERRAEEY